LPIAPARDRTVPLKNKRRSMASYSKAVNWFSEMSRIGREFSAVGDAVRNGEIDVNEARRRTGALIRELKKWARRAHADVTSASKFEPGPEVPPKSRSH
jgi:hypothetical protein